MSADADFDAHESAFADLGVETTGSTNLRRFRAFFGASPRVCAALWTRILPLLDAEATVGAERRHLLWALHFLKVYDVEEVSARLFSVTEKTFRRRVREMVGFLARADMVSCASAAIGSFSLILLFSSTAFLICFVCSFN